jgi:hypothetical protein
MELGLFAGRCLVAVLHQHDSTSLWPRTSAVVDGKPLFLKELSRLWAKLDDAAGPVKSGHGAHDTVLLDNHAEKFERNPPHCCLEVPEWASASGTALPADRALAPGSALVAALAAKAGLSTPAPAYPDTLPPAATPAAAPAAAAFAAWGGTAMDPAAAALSAAAPAFEPLASPPPPPPRNGAPNVRASLATAAPAPTPAASSSVSVSGESAAAPAWARDDASVVAAFLAAFCASPAHRALNPGACCRRCRRRHFSAANEEQPCPVYERTAA